MIVVLCFLPVILTVIAYIASIVLDFHEVSFIVLREKRGQEDMRAEIDRIISEDLPSVAAQPFFENPLLEDLKISLSCDASFEVYSMNYIFSGDLPSSELSKFPPSKISVSGEKNFFIRAARKPNTEGVVAHRIDTAVEVSNDTGRVLWWREWTEY